MHLPLPHVILRKLSARMRCRQCRRRAGLLLALIALCVVAAVTGCGEQGLTSPDGAVPESTPPDTPAPGLAPDQGVATGAVAESATLAATRLPRSFFVDPRTGKNTNPGTKSLPFKTLARALSSALAQDTVRLASGVYSQATNGEQFTNSTKQIPVRAGVLILGTFAEEFTSQLHGATNEIGLLLQGGATVRNLILSGFSQAIRASQGVQSFKRVILDQNRVGIDLTGTAQATLTGGNVFLSPPPSAEATGVRVLQQAQFIMDGGFISGGGPNCRTNVIGVLVGGASGRAIFRNAAQLKDLAGNALLVADGSKATLKGLTTIARNFTGVSDCTPRPSVVTLNSASLTLQNARIFGGGGDLSVGIESHSGGPLTVTNSVLLNHSFALQVFTNTKVVISGSSFSGNDIGIDVRALPALNMSITGSTVSNNTTGIIAPFFKLRNSKVTGNQFGIVVKSNSADLGTVGDIGKNILTANSVTAVEFFGESGLLSGTIFAAGNQWNASTQDSDANGLYPANPLVNGTSPFRIGKNFILPQGNAAFAIQL